MAAGRRARRVEVARRRGRTMSGIRCGEHALVAAKRQMICEKKNEWRRGLHGGGIDMEGEKMKKKHLKPLQGPALVDAR